MKPRSRLAAMCTTAILLGVLLTVTFLGACRKPIDNDDENHQAQAGNARAQVSTEDGQSVLTLDGPTQTRLGIQTATLSSTITRDQLTLPAMVLSGQDLATSRNSYVALQAQLQKSHIEEGVASKEYARLKSLFEANQNISQKLLQSAEGTLLAQQADTHAAEQQLNLQEATVRQEWGTVVAKWVVESSSNLQGIFDQSKIFVQMTMPSTLTLQPPEIASLEIPGGNRTEASFISSFPRTDPRIQGRSFLYIAPAHLGLAPGVNLLVHVSIGSKVRGVIVPTSAVVWSEGQAWVYQEKTPDHFARHSVTTDIRLENGFFVSRGFLRGERVVIRGAQDLLSQELLSHGQGGGESDEN